MVAILYVFGRTSLAFLLLYGGVLSITQDMDYNYDNATKLFSKFDANYKPAPRGDQFAYYLVIAQGGFLVGGATLLGLGSAAGPYLVILSAFLFMAASHNPALAKDEGEKMVRMSFVLKDLVVIGACLLQIALPKKPKEFWPQSQGECEAANKKDE